MTSHNLRGLLAQHIGSQQKFRHFASRAHYTEGVRHFAEQAGAFWLLDIIMTEPKILEGMRREGFIVIALNVKEGKGSLTARRDTDCPNLFERFIAYTDCPEGEWRFYFSNDMLMLPSEY